MRKESELTVKYYSQKFNFVNHRNHGIPDMDCGIQMNAPLPAKVNASTFLRRNRMPIFIAPSYQLVNCNLELQSSAYYYLGRISEDHPHTGCLRQMVVKFEVSG
ncbi:hypothetical protein AVEN_271872-1 [Araneus ventricosus]|uniref:Uncharacterized protein n=1 Tax=Araneus ventricosus TaxID=182803 RepID=A0A4Y2KGS1_ARAVE|nr:hypothetical protein AVEN_271872-1 [Araneus ventricosus]